MSSNRLQRQLAVNLFLLLSSVYFLTTSGNTADTTDDSMQRYAVTQRLIERADFDLPGSLGERFGVRGVDGRYYMKYGLGQPLLAIPFFALGKSLGNPKFVVSYLSILASSLTCVVLFYLGVRLGYSTRISTRLALVAGLCTQVWPESKSPFDHAIETLFCTLALLFLYSAQDRQWRFALAGASLGFASLTRVTAILWLLPWALFLFFSNCRKDVRTRLVEFMKRGALVAAGLLPFVIAISWYNKVRFGSVFETGYGQWALERSFQNFGNPVGLGLAGELISPGKGILWYSPVILLFIFALPPLFRRNRQTALLCLLATGVYLLFFAKYAVWHGDIAWGPRFLVMLIPLWVLCIGALWDAPQTRRPVLTILTRGLIAAGFFVQVLAVMIDMNLHYYDLMKRGVIQNVNSYSFPPKIYFDAQYSPLYSRWSEIRGLFDKGLVPTPGPESSDTFAPSLDFWWARYLTGDESREMIILIGPFVFEIILSGMRLRRLMRTADAYHLNAVVH
jgi:Dolichyl-phosphate-mannose-protein mannosyltransferase